MYWALTMVMKSPWLAPARTSEQIYASVIVVMGAMAFAVFIGLVTAMIASYDKSNAQYRDQVTTLHQYGRAKLLPASMRQSLIQYHDEYWTNAHQGCPSARSSRRCRRTCGRACCSRCTARLIEKCAWLQECSLMGCAEFLLKLQPEVCRKGDSVLLAGTVPSQMYILYNGELQITYPPPAGLLNKIKQLLGDEAGDATSQRKQSTRVPQGRVDRAGTLIGFTPPFGPPKAIRYSVRAYSRSTFYSISRDDFREVLSLRQTDAPIFMKAIEHANKVLNRDEQRTRDGESKARRSSENKEYKTAEELEAMKAEAAAADADAGGGRRDSSAATCKRRSSASAAAEINPAELEQIEASREARRQGWLPSEGGDGGGGGGAAAARRRRRRRQDRRAAGGGGGAAARGGRVARDARRDRRQARPAVARGDAAVGVGSEVP